MLTQKKLLAVAAAMVTLAAGCSSTAKHSAATGGGGTTPSSTPAPGTNTANHNITIGVLTDLSGPAASGNKTSVMGVAAGAVEAAKLGFNIKYISADSQTSPAAIQSAAQQLVEQDHVSAVIAVSALTFGAANYLKAQGIPVIGAAEDGPEWIPDTNMFSVYGFLDGTQVSTTTGLFFKSQGVTTVGSIGYGISPGSSEGSKSAAASAQAAGLKVGYLNAQFPFGSTNVAPIAIAMKNAHVDGVTSSTDPNTSFALVTALRQAGDNPKVALLPDGYGGDLVQAGPGAIQTGQGVYFTLSFEPAEMHTTATNQFQNDLKAVGVTGDPTYGEYAGYASVALLVDALKAVGTNASHAQLVAALTAVKGFNAWGLLGTHSFDLGNRAATATGVDSCIYVTKLQGNNFQLVPGADPLCGSPIPGVKVSASS